MNLQSLIKDAEKYYSNEWGTASVGYEERGFYDWCINEINECKNIFEVGSGIGISTERIIKSGSNVTSIEENQFNFEKTVSRLKTSGVTFGTTNRYNLERFTDAGNNLILGNFITDKLLHDEVIKQLNFDCIVCWFVGVHPATHAKNELRELGYKERHPPTYRDLIYDKLFSETSKYLREGGIISLIERSELFPNQDVVEEHIKEFSSYYYLEKYGFKITKIAQLKVENIQSLPGIKMEAFDGDNLVDGADQKREHGLTSIIIKRV